uniref:glucan endo-1,3-beta-D-glucosidase n=1 Tax=Albugo laibachii Nc14 TaxID=890382 RepID=F0VZL9_9STRA|nr:conserved hypothetical protein [Albugo laibachii Nc14]|eukprot:CCA14249.1 conserved hypothetical protein [Albugo laibachii Nc14]
MVVRFTFLDRLDGGPSGFKGCFIFVSKRLLRLPVCVISQSEMRISSLICLACSLKPTMSLNGVARQVIGSVYGRGKTEAEMTTTTQNEIGYLPGVCYSPMHNPQYPLNGQHSADGLDVAMNEDFNTMKKYFGYVRTYYSQYYQFPIAPIAAAHGIRLFLGIYVTDEDWYKDQVEAAVQAVIKYPDTVACILVGNENVAPYGPYRPMDIGSRIKALRSEVAERAPGSRVQIGTVQRSAEWMDENIRSDMLALAELCDIVGVNIYTFFDKNNKSPGSLEQLNSAWSKMSEIYPPSKLRLTEIGWPTAGSPSVVAPDNIPSLGNSVTFYSNFLNWKPPLPGKEAFWFMFFDRRSDDNTMNVDLEKFFGLFNPNRDRKQENYPILRPRANTNIPKADVCVRPPDISQLFGSEPTCRVVKRFLG